MTVEEKIYEMGVIPVVVINDASKAENLAKAFIDGGLPCAEITFRTDAAQEAIRKVADKYPEMLVGAGTVVTLEQAEKAVKAGAKFLVSPGYDQVLVDWAKEHSVPYFPGVATASELQVAVRNGFSVLKFFPAEAAGGVKMIKNLCGPFPQVKFIPTGGISMDNICSYASDPHVFAIGGSWIAKSNMIENEEWTKITGLCKEAVEVIKKARATV